MHFQLLGLISSKWGSQVWITHPSTSSKGCTWQFFSQNDQDKNWGCSTSMLFVHPRSWIEPLKMIVGRQAFPFGKVSLQGRTVKPRVVMGKVGRLYSQEDFCMAYQASFKFQHWMTYLLQIAPLSVKIKVRTPFIMVTDISPATHL